MYFLSCVEIKTIIIIIIIIIISGFMAQLVRASHRYREVTGSNPFEVLNFFFRLPSQLHKLHS